MSSRFLTLADVSETLNISAAQAYALVRCGDLPAIKVGGRGQWRIEAAELENYISRMYAQTRTLRIADGPDEVHHMVVGRNELRQYRESPNDPSMAAVFRN